MVKHKMTLQQVLIVLIISLNCVSFTLGNGESLSQIKLKSVHTCCDLNNLGFGQNTCPETKKDESDIQTQPNDPNSEIWNVNSKYMSNGQETQFRPVVKNLQCKKSKEILKEYKLGVDTENEPLIQIMPDGYLSIGHFKKEQVNYLHKDQYCINGKIDETKNILKIKMCKPTCTKSEPCVRKCCPIDHIMDAVQKCVPAPPKGRWTPKLFRKPSNPETILKDKDVDEGIIRLSTNYIPTWLNNCEDGNVLLHSYSHHIVDHMRNHSDEEVSGMVDTITRFNFRMDQNGKIRYRDVWRNWVTMKNNIYCVDGYTGYSESEEYREFNNTIDEDILFACPPEFPKERQASEYYAAFAITTSMFALLTVISYFLLLDKQNIHGWTTMSHSTSVFLLFVFLGIAHLTKHDEDIHGSFGCKFIATAAHYFFIATFSWLLLISFDLWCTFRSISLKRSGVKRFLGYSAFGWGIPAFVVFLSWGLEIKYADDENTEVKVPSYGTSFCYISRFSLWQYLYTPMAILLILNIIFFVWTAIKLHHYQQSTKLAKQNLKKNKQSSRKLLFRFLLFVKLFFVVGLLWVIEILSFSISGGHVSIYWQILDTLNVLQPVFIFLIFVFKWEVINPIHEKYPALRPIVYPARKTLKLFRKSTKLPSVNSESTGITVSTASTRAPHNHHEASYAKVTSEAIEEIPLKTNTKRLSDE